MPDPTALDRVLSKDPNEVTDADLDEIIAFYRKERQTLATLAPKAKSVDAPVNLSLKDLDI